MPFHRQISKKKQQHWDTYERAAYNHEINKKHS